MRRNDAAECPEAAQVMVKPSRDTDCQEQAKKNHCSQSFRGCRRVHRSPLLWRCGDCGAQVPHLALHPLFPGNDGHEMCTPICKTPMVFIRQASTAATTPWWAEGPGPASAINLLRARGRRGRSLPTVCTMCSRRMRERAVGLAKLRLAPEMVCGQSQSSLPEAYRNLERGVCRGRKRKP
ncbi:hypothetical protein EJ04DRAFT_80619 [Polyplosphaeria fusca]|uniref:Uncharacterized protein n=1 Tax=Polyplosphaeria fusca TaxID=682080 RepID=A0A9P4V4Q8_9PLEO|nr:hypothetical protein EJ04DRAFT_80619 [Polyplosphaeria fusca]